MELRHLRYFLAVAQEGSFTRAAQKLSIAQPPLSRQIQDLERELGAELFLRSPRGLRLTREGELFRQRAEEILALADKTTEEIREEKNQLSGTVCLGSAEGAGPRLFGQWIAGFQALFPLVRFRLREDRPEKVTDHLRQGLCDLAVTPPPARSEGLRCLRVYEEPLTAVLPSGHPLAQDSSGILRPEDLPAEELILPDSLTRAAERVGEKPAVRCEVTRAATACELAGQGIGIALVPASAADQAASGRTVIRPLADLRLSSVLIWKKDRPLSPASQKFLEYVQEEVRTVPLSSPPDGE